MKGVFGQQLFSKYVFSLLAYRHVTCSSSSVQSSYFHRIVYMQFVAWKSFALVMRQCHQFAMSEVKTQKAVVCKDEKQQSYHFAEPHCKLYNRGSLR